MWNNFLVIHIDFCALNYICLLKTILIFYALTFQNFWENWQYRYWSVIADQHLMVSFVNLKTKITFSCFKQLGNTPVTTDLLKMLINWLKRTGIYWFYSWHSTVTWWLFDQHRKCHFWIELPSVGRYRQTKSKLPQFGHHTKRTQATWQSSIDFSVHIHAHDAYSNTHCSIVIQSQQKLTTAVSTSQKATLNKMQTNQHNVSHQIKSCH